MAFGAVFFIDDVQADSVDGMGTVASDTGRLAGCSMWVGHEVVR